MFILKPTVSVFQTNACDIDIFSVNSGLFDTSMKIDTGTARGAGDKFEVCDDDGEEMGEGHDGNDSDDDDKDDNDDDNDIGAFRLSR